MLIRFRIPETAKSAARVYHRHVRRTRRFLLGRLVSATFLPQTALLRVVGIGTESGVLTIDLR